MAKILPIGRSVPVVFGLSFLFHGAAVAGGCWVDIYESAGLQGNHVRVVGPAQMHNLKNLRGEDWGGRIASLQVGPRARVVLCRQESCAGSATEAIRLEHSAAQPAGRAPAETSFGPDHQEQDLAGRGFYKNAKAFEIKCLY